MKFDLVNQEAFLWHCEVAALIIGCLPINPHTKHHIRGAIREASLKVTKNKGTGIKRASHVSILAQEKLETMASRGLILEHAIPISLINDKILAISKPTKFDIAEIVYEWTILAVITKKEHEMLRINGFNDKMPTNWDGVDKFARYEACKIQVTPIRQAIK